MVKAREMTAAVSDLRKEMSRSLEMTPPVKADNESSQDHSSGPPEETDGDDDLQLKDVEHLLKEHGLDVDELKGLWEQFSNELRDLPAKKPLVAMFGAFLLGFLAGRMSQKRGKRQ